jgi:hypothetical protein
LEKAHLSERDKCILEELKENQGSASALSDQGLIKKADH